MTKSRSTILLNRKFQLRFALYVCFSLIIFSLAYPLIVSSMIESLVQYLAVDPLGPTFAKIENTRRELLWLLLAMELTLIGESFIFSIFVSHRIVGPLYKLGQFFEKARQGNFEEKLAFRKNDHFPELATGYNAMTEAFRRQISQRTQGILSATALLEDALGSVNPETKIKLEAALTALRDAEKGR